jgi:hypothetical protein
MWLWLFPLDVRFPRLGMCITSEFPIIRPQSQLTLPNLRFDPSSIEARASILVASLREDFSKQQKAWHHISTRVK